MNHFLVAAGESRTPKMAVLGGQIAIKVSGRDTDGAYAVLEIPTAPLSGPPLHFHIIENEWFYVLEGEHDFQIGNERLRLRPGASVLAPKLIPHTWVNVGGCSGKMLTVAQPAGRLEEFFSEFGEFVSRGRLDPGQLGQVFEKYAMKVVGPPLSVDTAPLISGQGEARS
jgi:mannose-6-phosphate isomerase-like protein (cupin superfamily)